MKLSTKTVAGAMLFSSMTISAIAQQLPNGNFEGNWAPKAPWTSTGNTLSVGVMPKIELTSPEGWVASNVIGMQGIGATLVASKCEGHNGGQAVLLKNTANQYMASQIVPAYISLGTTWSTSSVAFSTAGITPEKNDGGSFGGIEFTNRPDALRFYYKLTRAKQAEGAEEDPTIKPKEKPTVVAYLWKGTWTQKDVPGNIIMGTTTTADMVNRDRNILGLETPQGGEVTKSDDADLVAVLNTNISYDDVTEWKLFEKELEYKSDATPAMANVIIAAGDYFGGADVVGKDNSLTVDNVRFVYYSRLQKLALSESKEIKLEDGKYDYSIDSEYPETDIIYTALGKSAKVEVTPDKANNKIVITVSNVDADIDGEKSHVYTLTFKAPATPKDYDGYLNIKMAGNSIASDQPAKVTITPTSETTCNFLLPNLTLPDLGNLGNIEVEGVNTTIENGVTTYSGSVDGMKLMNNAITANVVISGTSNEAGDIDMKIDVTWVDANLPIGVTFSNKRSSGINDIYTDDNDAPVEYFNLQGMRVSADNLTPGVYIRRQGSTTSKVLVK